MNRYQENQLDATQQLIEKCYYSNADQIAEIEAQLTVMGLSKLAGLARTEGLNNCGAEYVEMSRAALDKKFNGD